MAYRVVIVAAGSGERAGPGGPKQWRQVGGRAVARWSLKTFLDHGAAQVVVVVPNGDEARAVQAFWGLSGWSLVAGGATRTDSVKAGLAALEGGDGDVVMIHDAARPFVTEAHIEALIGALDDAGWRVASPHGLGHIEAQRVGREPKPRHGKDCGALRHRRPFRLGAMRAAYAVLTRRSCPDRRRGGG